MQNVKSDHLPFEALRSFFLGPQASAFLANIAHVEEHLLEEQQT